MHPKFDMFIITIIVLSAIQLALDSPLTDPASPIKTAVYWMDIITTTVFLAEAFLKVVTFGFIINGDSSYLMQPWNILDFVIIVFSILAMTPLSDNLRTVKIFRVFRILRLIGRNEKLRVALRALFLAIPNVANVTIIMILFFIIFGVIAVSYFKGKLFYCNNSMPVFNVSSKWDCLNGGGDWFNSIYNFDNTAMALVTLFYMSSTAGWSSIMYNCAQATSIDYVGLT